MAQTAVSWLIEQVNGYSYPIPYNQNIKIDIPKEIIEQAKAMEETNMIAFGKHCLDKALDLDIRTAHSKVEQYYNETYNK